jgi:rod shape-determining protein MreC
MQRFFLFFFGLFLFLLLSLSTSFTDHLRGKTVSFISSISAKGNDDKSSSPAQGAGNKRFYELEMENELLKEQMGGIYEWLTFHERIEEQVERLKQLSEEKQTDLYWQEFFQRRSEDLRKILEVEHQAMPAKVVFREPQSYGSSVWINVGSKNNESLGRLIVAKNSPVLLGSALVGVVEQVEEKISKVRLLTDSAFIPSVRANRGKTQDRYLYDLVHILIKQIHDREDLFPSAEDREEFFSELSSLQKNLQKTEKDWYLAKGELHGSSNPLWKNLYPTLKGIGFNYDVSDYEGPSRDLNTGKDLSLHTSFLPLSLIQKGDLLTTTGLDGVFPAGLQVAIVSKVFPLEEGSYSYSIEALPVCPSFDDLSVVFVLPPLIQKENFFP